MFVCVAVVAAGNLLVLQEPHELRNLPSLPIKIKYHLVLKMATLMAKKSILSSSLCFKIRGVRI